ncbi:MAG: hypothetical protein FJ104_15580, partial [Deltaproteobacteria bacterium]|nr:hypothetical protein [Deltaproteobacteria bacterium]
SRERRVRRERDFLELELAVVNNWERPLPEVSLLVTFFAADPPPSGRRTRTTDRTLFFEGPLLPGQAIKWHVAGRGSDFEVEVPAQAPLEAAGSDAAPTALAAELLRAHHRPVRLHGAMLLAYLGDPRGREGAIALRDALRDDEAPYLDRLLRATTPLRVCALRESGAPPRRGLDACVHNAGTEPLGGVSLIARALDAPFRYDTPVEPPPRVLAERSYDLAVALPPGTGTEVHVELDVTNPDGLVPQAYEAYAEPAEPATPAPAGSR